MRHKLYVIPFVGIIILGLITFSFRYFSQAFPLVSISITMNREQALDKAEELSQRYNWQPADNVIKAAYFHLDEEVRNYIELETGGNASFKEFLSQHFYEPYTWRVRRCKENTIEQTIIAFTPTGHIYGFVHTLAETTPGARLQSDQARSIAEKEATEIIALNLEDYKLIETSQQEVLSKRIDHTFVYELIDKKIGQALYRLTLIVSGDQLTAIKHWMFIPESFKRHYTELRSHNHLLFRISSLAMWLLYFLGSCLIGIIMLARRRWLITKPALIAGLILATFHSIAELNNLPLTLFEYDTASNLYVFILQQLAAILYEWFYYAIMYIFSIMAAESLTRAAFGNQLQFWKLWSPHAFATTRVTFQIIVGYLAVPLFCAYVIAFYALGAPLFNWWTPSDMLIDPNILATFIPWLTPLTRSTVAGFWEECLFRAVPLASGALLGQRLGSRRGGIIVAFIVQILIFGAMHANYPGFPYYIRLVELIFISSVFGFLYLYCGLLAGIISHVLYDIFWFSLPIFVSTAPGSLFAKIMILLCSSSFLVFTLWQRFVKPASGQIALNKAWHPAPAQAAGTRLSRPEHQELPIKVGHKALVIGLCSLVLWIFTCQWRQDAPALPLTRMQALQQAADYVADQGIDIAPWTERIAIQTAVNQADRFVWQKAGEGIYRQLQDSYLMPPAWYIRFMKTNVPVAERAEEYHVWITPQGVIRFEHILPEHVAGATLSDEQARHLAQQVLQKHHIDPQTVLPITARSNKLPERLDWLFEYEDPAVTELNKEIKGRIIVKIAGDQAVDFQRIIFVPEEFQRHERNLVTLYTIVQLLITLLFAALVMISVWFIYQKTSYRLLINRRHLLFLVGIWTLLVILHFINVLPFIMSLFNTTEPQSTQLFSVLFSTILKNIMRGLAIFAIFSLIYHATIRLALGELIAASSLGLSFVAINGLITLVTPKISPLWTTASLISADTFIPFIGTNIQLIIMDFVFLCMIGYLIVTILDVYERSGKGIFSIVVFGLLALLNTPLSLNTALITWLTKVLASALVLAFGYYAFLRHRSAALPWFLGVLVAARVIQEMVMNSWSGAISNGFSALIMLGIVVWYLTRHCAIEVSNRQ